MKFIFGRKTFLQYIKEIGNIDSSHIEYDGTSKHVVVPKLEREIRRGLWFENGSTSSGATRYIVNFNNLKLYYLHDMGKDNGEHALFVCKIKKYNKSAKYKQLKGLPRCELKGDSIERLIGV